MMDWTEKDAMEFFEGCGLHISDGIDSCSGHDNEAMSDAAKELAAKINAEIVKLKEVNATLLAALKAIVNNNSYWWQEVGEEVAEQAKVAVAKGEAKT